MDNKEFDISTTEGARAYLENEGLDVDNLIKEGLEFIEKIKVRIDLEKRWIPIDRLDLNDYDEVLVLLENGEYFKAMYCDDIDFNFTSPYFEANKGSKITHYMPVCIPSKQAKL